MPDVLPIPAELLVLGLALLLYLTDLARLLFANEVLFSGTVKGHWKALTPANGFPFNRRNAVFPRVWDAGNIECRVAWPSQPADSSQTIDDALSVLAKEAVFERLICRALVPQLFIGVPIAYSLPSNDLPTLVMIALIYLQVVALVVGVMIKRRRLCLSTGHAAWLAFESLVCLPYALNVFRKIGANLTSQARSDVLDLAARLLDADDRHELHERLRRSASDRRDALSPATQVRLDEFTARLGVEKPER
ncbi:MAG: hypothetical protein AAGA33_03050 [Pseudomonadota bacterium]